MQFIYGCRLSLRNAEADSHGPAVDHRDFAVAVCVWWSMSLVCSRAGSSSAAAVLLRGRPHPCRCAESIPWSRQFVRTGIPQLLYKVVDVPVVQVVQVHFPVVAQRQSPWSFDHGHSQLQYTWPMSLLCRSCRFTSPSLRRGSLHSRLTMDIPSCRTRWPMSLLCRSCRFNSPSGHRGSLHGPNCSFDHGRCPCRGGVQTWRRQLSSHSCSSSFCVDTVVHIPVVVQRQMPGGSDVTVAVTSRG